jgi:hypothetical protein
MPPTLRLLPVLLAPTIALALLVEDLDGQTLRGSRASVDRVYFHAVNNGIRFYETSAQINDGVRTGRLVSLPGNANYRLHAVSYPYALPEARTFIERLAGQYRSACGEQLVVTSATRPRSMRLANSVARTVHPTGMAIDLRRPANQRCLSWLRSTLTQLDAAGVIEATEERSPPHFHVAVYPRQYSQYVQRRGGSVYVSAASSARQQHRHRVARGDSLWTLARRYGTTIERIQLANNLRTTTIRVGQTLVIP